MLGPLLRYVGSETATVWVDTDAPAEVGVLGRRAQTFHVSGHHYALIVVDGLEPGSVTPYEVLVDGSSAGQPDIRALNDSPTGLPRGVEARMLTRACVRPAVCALAAVGAAWERPRGREAGAATG